ncbi:AsmA family protein [Duganella qianjiadongensis]|uniref:AsmA family protein n=1 Tax=Duganella qianjiadongensis TaxID=2692176 RepID=A0ABW9VFH0_9BURK|nr:AsmA family protein [Duganella qianjiadongensis]MYM38208.1 AsmA family protein [Duganella qianjiadongensis]
MPLRRRTVFLLAVPGILAALLAGIVLLLTHADWNRARPWLNDKISVALQRPFAIRGDLTLHWSWSASRAGQQGWRAYLPMPRLLARDLHLAHPALMTEQGELAHIDSALIEIELLPLLENRLSIPLLRLEQPKILLMRRADGRSNWEWTPPRQPGTWKLELHTLELANGQVQLRDAVQQLELAASMQTLKGDPLYGVAWQLQGHWKQQPVQGQGKAGAVLGLQEQTRPYPLEALLDVGGSRIVINGTLTRPARLTSLDLQLSLSGASMARLYGLTGVLLPETPAFSTTGHLHGELGEQSSRWQYQNFMGRVGQSDIGGNLEYRYGRALKRPQLSGAVQAQLLRLSDLGPLIGADSNRSKQARGMPAVQPENKVLPVEAFRKTRWTALDADVRFSAARITREQELPITQVDSRILLRDGILSLEPLQFQIAGGSFDASVKLDGSGHQLPDAIAASLKARARHLHLKQLFPRIEAMQATVGEINAEIALNAQGNSVAELLGASNGELRGVVSKGSISKLLLEEMGLNLGSVVLTRLVGDKQVQLNCLISDFSVTNGLMQTRLFAADTTDARIDVSGQVSLRKEQLDLTLRPQAKGVRIISLRAPIYLRGSFKQPDISIDKQVLALRAGGALALAAVAPITAILPLMTAGSSDDAGCVALLAKAGQHSTPPDPARKVR